MKQNGYFVRYEKEEIMEAKEYYRKEALKISHAYQQASALRFLAFFDHYYNIQEGNLSIEDLIEKDTEYLQARNNLNRVEMKIQNYFNCKSKNRL